MGEIQFSFFPPDYIRIRYKNFNPSEYHRNSYRDDSENVN